MVSHSKDTMDLHKDGTGSSNQMWFINRTGVEEVVVGYAPV